MSIRRIWQATLLAAATGGGLSVSGHAEAQPISLNYESLSSMEEPLAFEIGDVTFALTGLVDARWIIDTDGDDADTSLIGNFQVNARTQLPNRLLVDLTYFGQDASGPTTFSGAGDNYTDNVALSVGSYWGAVLGGNVSGTVREQTRRLRGAGNAALAFDDFLGTLDEWSGGYTGRFGPWVVGTVVDEDGDLDLGAIFQRPAGTRDWRLTLRAAEGEYTPVGGNIRFDTRGFGVVGEVIYGSTTIDTGAGYEHFSSSGPGVDRWYLSSGVRWKSGALTISLEGHIGRIEGKDEKSASVGAQYDIARGVSANLGLNYAKAQVLLDGAPFLDTEESKAVLSFRYSF